jgi:hypothetical protein
VLVVGAMTATKTPPRRRGRDRTAHKPLRELTVDHWRAYARRMVLDTGEYWDPEPFQLDFVKEILAGVTEVLLDIPEGNTKTTTCGGFALYFGDYKLEAMIPVAAASREQAMWLFNQAAGFVRRTPGLERRFRVYEGYRRISCLRSRGQIQVFAADDRTGDGVIFDLAFLEEMHRQRDLRLYRTWHGKTEKRGGQLAGISTAGEPGSEYEDIKAEILKRAHVRRRGAHTIARTPDLVLHQYALRPGDDIHDLELVKQANPFSGVTIEGLRRKHDSPTMRESHWKRFVCGIATKGENTKIQPEEWDRLRKAGLEFPVDAPHKAMGLDLGWKIDHTAITPVAWASAQRRVIADAVTLAPPVDEHDIVAGLLDRQERLGITVVVYDPNAGGQQMAQMLERGEHPLQTDDDLRARHGLARLDGRVLEPLVFVEHSQDNAPMALAASRFDEALRTGILRHDGSAKCATAGCPCGGLRGHVLNAIERSVGTEKWKYDRPRDAKGGEKRAQTPIDGITSAVMAHSVLWAQANAPAREKPLIEFWA